MYDGIGEDKHYWLLKDKINIIKQMKRILKETTYRSKICMSGANKIHFCRALSRLLIFPLVRKRLPPSLTCIARIMIV